MKKTFESWKIWTILSALLFFMTCGVFIVHAAGSSNNWLFTQKYNTGALNNTLTATWWNQLMGDLDNLIPEGAIMAFNLDKCPTWWNDYSLANGRFLMWETSDIGGIWWKNSITEVPNHSHFVLDYLNQVNGNGEINVGTMTINWESVTVWRATRTGDPTKRAQTNDDGHSDIPYIKHRVQSTWASSVDITNPYVKVRYCIKWTPKVNYYSVNFIAEPGWTVSNSTIQASLNSQIKINENNVTIWNKTVTASPWAAYHFDRWTNNCGGTLTKDCTIHANFQANPTCTFEIYWDCLWTPQNIQNCEEQCKSEAGVNCAGDVVQCSYIKAQSMCKCNLR